jgi:bacterial/archaeal transporter family-2 protein
VSGPHAGRTAARTGGVALAVIGGTMVAFQSRINGELAARVHSGIFAALISFGTGLLILSCAVALSRPARAGLARVAALLGKGELRWWECVGGACGAFVVASQGLTVGALGVSIFIVSLVAGQSISSLLVDRAGLAPGGKHPVTANRTLGTVLTVVAVLIAVSTRLGTPATLALAVLPFLAGAGSSWQSAMNGRVRQASGGALPTTFINFVVGTTALLIAFLLWGAPFAPLPPQPWLYLGGIIGMTFIGIAAAVVRFTGVLLLSLGMIAGQVVGALAVDALVPGGAGTPTTSTLAGAALTLVAVGIAAWHPRRRSAALPGDPITGGTSDVTR